MWYAGFTEFARRLSCFHILLIGSRVLEILAASVHYCLDERRMEDVPPPKTVLDKKNPKKKAFRQKYRPVVMGLLTVYTQKIF